MQVSCHDVLFKPIEVVVQNFFTESGEGATCGLTPMFPGWHSVARLFPLFLTLLESWLYQLSESVACIETIFADTALWF